MEEEYPTYFRVELLQTFIEFLLFVFHLYLGGQLEHRIVIYVCNRSF